jgi:hypothetical protein
MNSSSGFSKRTKETKNKENPNMENIIRLKIVLNPGE